jgi:hypothetical protein
MKLIFLTEKIINNEIYEGERVYADSFEEAVEEAIYIGVDLIGFLCSEYYQVPV